MSLWAALRFCVHQRTWKFHAPDLKVKKQNTVFHKVHLQHMWEPLKKKKKNLYYSGCHCYGVPEGPCCDPKAGALAAAPFIGQACCWTTPVLYYSRLCERVASSDVCLPRGSEHDADSHLSPRSVTAAWQDCEADLIPPRLVHWQPFSPAASENPSTEQRSSLQDGGEATMDPHRAFWEMRESPHLFSGVDLLSVARWRCNQFTS